MSRQLIDTGAIFAFVVKTDAHHGAARAHLATVLKGGTALVLVDLVFAETMTLLKARVGSAAAIKAGRELRDNPRFAWHVLGADIEREAWGLFQKFADKEWSYTDCAVLAASRELRIPHVFAFDRHFRQMPGVVSVP